MKTVISIVVFLLLSFTGWSQENDTLEANTPESNIETISVLQQSTRIQSSAATLNNVVMVQQIGSYNNVYANIVSSQANVKINQFGRNNDVALQLKAAVVNENITQIGRNNTVLDYTPGVSQGAGLQLVQQGNNLSFERYGSNSLTNGLKIRMQGDSKSVIVRSYR